MQAASPFDQAAVRLLADLGFAAAGRADVAHARAIFEGLQDLRGSRAFPYIGKALAYLNAGRPDEAVAALEAAQGEVTEERADIDAFLGLALQMAGQSAAGAQAFARAASGPRDSDGARLARRMLGLLDDSPSGGMR
jgi:hypothetical protein